MKQFIIALLFFTAVSLSAQKQVEKEINYEGQPVEMEFQFASSIEFISWDKPTIQVKAVVETEEEKYTDMFELNVKENSSKISISSNSRDIFQAHQKDEGKLNIAVLYSEGLEHNFDYKVYLPTDVKLNISSITGSIASDSFEGNIKAELVNGDIEIKKFKGDLDLKTINGKIELPSQNTSIAANTVIGHIHTKSNLKEFRKDKFVGEEVKLVSNDSDNHLKLHTINGDIFLR